MEIDFVVELPVISRAGPVNPEIVFPLQVSAPLMRETSPFLRLQADVISRTFCLTGF
jgi:hypothetical protein